MRITITAFVVGVASLSLWQSLPSLAWLIFNVVLLPLCWRWSWLRPVAALVAGFSWALLQAGWRLDAVLPGQLEGVDVVVQGEIASVPEFHGRNARFILQINKVIKPQNISWAGRVRLGWYRTSDHPKAGEHWQLTIRMKKPHGFMNPGGFDYEAWLFRRNIQATGYVRRARAHRLPGHTVSIDRFRESVSEKIGKWLPESRFTGILTALAIGVRDAIRPTQWQVLRRTGTSHLVAISGLHVGIVSGLVYLLIGAIWRRCWRLTQFCATPRAAALAAIFGGAAYAAMAGFSIPTQRALIMLVFVMLAIWRQRIILPSRILVWALLLVVLIDPFATLDAGFWLSFAAVAVILYSVTGRYGVMGKWRQAWHVQWVVALGLAPLTVFLFGQASLVSPLANLVAVPWISLLVVPLVLPGIVAGLFVDSLGSLLFGLADLAISAIWQLLEWLSSLSVATLSPGAGISLPALLLMIPALAWLLAPRGFPGRPAAIVLLLPALLNQVPVPVYGSYRVDVLDVGQGLAVVVQTAEHTLIYDTGPYFSRRFDAGKAVIVPFLRFRGISKVDRLIISHADKDHRGGAMSLREAVPVGDILSGMPKSLGFPARACHAGQAWQWDGVSFRILHPVAGVAYKRNNRSCVLMVSNRGGRLLLTGDIHRKVERQLLRRRGASLKADIMLVPHHGSRTSSGTGFIDSVRPSIAIVTTGYRNRFGHPKPDIRSRYLARGIRWLDTVNSGAISIRVHPASGIGKVHQYRRSKGAFWNQGPVGRNTGRNGSTKAD